MNSRPVLLFDSRQPGGLESLTLAGRCAALQAPIESAWADLVYQGLWVRPVKAASWLPRSTRPR